MSAPHGGRDDELRALDGLLDEAPTGFNPVALVRGEAGIGKSWLLAQLRRRAEDRGFTVLGTVGRSADAELAYASLLTLLRPVEPVLAALAGEHTDDLQFALALRAGDTDPVGTGLGLFRVLAAMSERTPLLVSVDDAHLLDAASAGALCFAIGRLDADRVVTVATADADAVTALDDLATHLVVLGPLDGETIMAVLGAVAELDADVMRRCVELAGGNPLAARAMALSLTPGERLGRAPLPVVPRPSAALLRGFTSLLGGVDDAVRRALVVVAADDTGDVAVVTSALVQLGEPAESLDAAEAAGLVVRRGAELRMAHPLLRAVAYHQVGPASRRAAHRALAAALGAPEQAAARAWQLAAAATGPDREAAEALELVARDAERRGAPASAGRAFEHAAHASVNDAERGDRLVAAARSWLAAGEVEAVRRAATAATLLPLAPHERSRLAAILRWVDGAQVALACLEQGSAGEGDAGFVAAQLDELAHAGAADIEARAARVAEEGGAAAALAVALLALLGDEPPAGDEPSGDPRVLVRTGEALLEAGELEAAAALMETAGGDDPMAAAARVADLRHRGRLLPAIEAAQRIVAGPPARNALWRAPVDAVLADVEMLLGRSEDARDRAEAAVLVADAAGLVEVGDRARWVLARLDVEASDAPAAIARLDGPARRRPLVYGPDLVVALAADGGVDDARARLDRLRALPGAAAPLAAARLDRALAACGIDSESAETFPIDAAEAALARAEAARSSSSAASNERAGEARRMLRAAGVSAWSSRLARLQHEETSARSQVEAMLSPAEFRVAAAVAGGRTNREVADALFLSVKTVDFHLQAIYRKLGLRSRTELAVRMSGAVERRDTP